MSRARDIANLQSSKITADAGIDIDNINIDGTEIDLSSGDLTIDVAGEINLDTDGAVVNFKDGGTTFGLVTQSSNDFVIRNPTLDKHILFKGNDGGSTITALDLDIANAGKATFNDDVLIPRYLEHVGDSDTYIGFPAANDFEIVTGGGARMLVDATETVFNEGSLDLDFRVEGNNHANAFFVNGEYDGVAINSNAPISYANGQAVLFIEDTTNPAIAISDTGQSKDYFITANGSALNFNYADGSNSSSASNVTSLLSLDNGGTATFNSSINMNGNLIFTDNDLQIMSGAQDHGLFLAGGNNSNDGANISLGGPSRSSLANVTRFRQDTVESMRIDSSGNVLVGKSDTTFSTVGAALLANGQGNFTVSNNEVVQINRLAGDGDLVRFFESTNMEGSISVSGSTVSYNGFSGLHESSGIASNVAIGTVCSTIDELDTYATSTEKEGQPRADHAKIKVSDSVGDKRVYGVLQRYGDNDKPLVASVGIGSVKVTGACEGGDLLESNGDGTAKVQSDDIIRSKTIGKVTIGNSGTGVKLVSCVLYCG